MTKNRDFENDQQATNALLGAYLLISQQVTSRPNWLGHSGGAAQIDAALLEIAGASELLLGEFRGAVREHIDHLRREHGLAITEHEGVFRLARRDA